MEDSLHSTAVALCSTSTVANGYAGGKVSEKRSTEAHHERDAALLAEARLWVRQATQEFFDANRERPYTVAEVLSELDLRTDAPASWLRWLDTMYYQMRYALVRNACMLWLNRGLLETGTTMNARGREGVVCYQRTTETKWFVEIAGDDADESRIVESMLKWVRGNPRLLRGATSVLLTRKPTKKYETRRTVDDDRARKKRT